MYNNKMNNKKALFKENSKKTVTQTIAWCSTDNQF